MAFLGARDRGYACLDLESQGEWREDGFTFVQLADTQFGLLSATKPQQWMRRLRVIEPMTCGLVKGNELIPLPLDGRPDMTEEDAYEEEKAFSRRAVDAINAMEPRPAFAVVCGDLVHAAPSDGELQEQQVADFKAIFSEVHADIPLVCTCGNHDIGDRPNSTTIDLWKERFGDDYFSFWVGGVKFIVINSQLYKDARDCPELAKEQDVWLDGELTNARAENARHTIVMSHIPPFINAADESDGYFPLTREVRIGLLERMSAAGVSHWFCGHYHRNASGVFEGADGGRIEVVTTAAVGTNITTDETGDPLGLSGMDACILDDNYSGLRVVRVARDGVTHQFHTLAELV